MLELQPVPLLSSLFYNSKIYHIEAKYVISSLDRPELNFLQHRYYRESTFLAHKLQPSISFKRGSHAPGLWVEFQAPPVSWSVCEYDIFIASILYSRKICLEYPLLVSGSTPKSGIYLQISLSSQTFAFPQVLSSNLPKPSLIDLPKVITMEKV
jgi:hypothetical protein